ncbi:uncharacterized protein si:dkey-12l12.1 isoform X2 [Antennarius striatus]|uniref:uncharacterized protein si:dkey-12l12.1 isoform X2 n=1 Tax=Antennarius striatus TaxID=241820 RepID=UPI0035B33C35
MGFTVWLCVLCMQASLLSHAIDCSGATQGELCVSGQTADSQHDEQKQHNMPPGKEAVADRSRRHLVHSANKRKSKRKSRVGSFSLLSNDKKSNPLQVIRAKRQVKADPPKKNSSGRAGALSVLGDPQNDGQNDRPRRNTQMTSAEN